MPSASVRPKLIAAKAPRVLRDITTPAHLQPAMGRSVRKCCFRTVRASPDRASIVGRGCQRRDGRTLRSSQQLQKARRVASGWEGNTATPAMDSGGGLLVMNACSFPSSHSDLGASYLAFMELLQGLNTIILVRCLARCLLWDDHSISVRLSFIGKRVALIHPHSILQQFLQRHLTAYILILACLATQHLHWMQLDLDCSAGSFVLLCKSGVVRCPGLLFCQHDLSLNCLERGHLISENVPTRLVCGQAHGHFLD